jgi:S1-C subfamily serine protease
MAILALLTQPVAAQTGSDINSILRGAPPQKQQPAPQSAQPPPYTPAETPTASNTEKAQEEFQVPSLGTPGRGVAHAIPVNAIPAIGINNVGIVSFGLTKQALSTQFKDSVPRTRGTQDVAVFRDSAPSVVLIKTKDGLGSGSLLKNNVILTNLHVVGKEQSVTVVFKPSDPSGNPKADEVVQADVIKISRQRDLALLRPLSVPSRPIHPLEISSQDSIDVGTDVVAIGHPNGEVWTFTRGIVSQFRPAYEWSGGPGDYKHVATVIQTQTPINPGNSGGPLLTEDGKIVGVNSFITRGAEGLNFAIAANELRYFLQNPSNDVQESDTCDKASVLFEGRNDKNTAFIRVISARCDDKADLIFVVPDNKREPIFALVDTNRRGKNDGLILDIGRTGRWNLSFWDANLDETFPLQGIHSTGTLFPTRYVTRCPKGTVPVKDFRCQ